MIIHGGAEIDEVEEERSWSCFCEPCKIPTCGTTNMCYVSVMYDGSIQRGCLTPDIGRDCPVFKGLETSCCTTNMCNDYELQTTSPYDLNSSPISSSRNWNDKNNTFFDVTSESIIKATPIVHNGSKMAGETKTADFNHSSASTIFSQATYYYYVGGIVLLGLILVTGILYITVRLRCKWPYQNRSKCSCCQRERHSSTQSATTNSSVATYQGYNIGQDEEPASTHSCFYQQTTFVKQLIFDKLIEKGSQIEIWKGTFQNDAVAIKCFRPPSIATWEREVKLYKSFSIRNDHILRYIGSDIGNLFYCIVFEYHDQLSLYDFLRNLPKTHGPIGLGVKQIYTLAYTASKGLLYLHNKISGADPKPSIAHRDIKSKNILVKRGDANYGGSAFEAQTLKPNEKFGVHHDVGMSVKKYHSLPTISLTKSSQSNSRIFNSCFTLNRDFGKYLKPRINVNRTKAPNEAIYSCCISDLGLAICDKESMSDHKIAVGTRRYMAPEVLNHTLETSDFESFKMTDIYSFGLVLWEIMTVYNPAYPKHPPIDQECIHTVPYFKDVPKNPTVDDMKDVVVDRKVRPLLKKEWQKSEVLAPLLHVIKECQSENPKSRLTALRIKLTLQKAWETLNNNNIF